MDEIAWVKFHAHRPEDFCLWCGQTMDRTQPEQKFCKKKCAKNQREHLRTIEQWNDYKCNFPEKKRFTYRGCAIRFAAYSKQYTYGCRCAGYHISSSKGHGRHQPILNELIQKVRKEYA